MKKPLFTPEMETFIRENAEVYTNQQLADMLNETFGVEKNMYQIRTFKRRHGLKSIQGSPSIFTKEIREFIQANYKGVGYLAMSKMIWREFDVWYPPEKIRGYYRNHKLNSGLIGSRFVKGQKPQNGCHKGYCIPGSEKGWFKKGNKPANHADIGTERLRANGYVWVKIGERKWRMKQLVIWEAAHGPVPKGYCLLFKDGDPTNCTLDNLMLTSRAANAVMNGMGLSGCTRELKETAVHIAELKMKTNEARRKKK